MKTIFRIMALFALLFCISSCEKDEAVDQDPKRDVNYANMAGTWKLSEWNGTKLDDSRYFYITLNRKEENGKRTYEIYQNFDSANPRHITGSYTIDNDDDLGDIITGEYDYWMGDWTNEYLVTELRSETMIWKVKDDLQDVSVYVRCSAVPEEIIKRINE